MERPRFSDHLEAIKFICKDFWSEVFKKQIDNLKTNQRQVPMAVSRVASQLSLQLRKKRKIRHVHVSAQVVSMYMYFPCGIIRGVLCRHFKPSHI
ncbi:unnamed protein product [Microthlaspi erraticum]|uniref:Uncharacterized protein n=1 Tax=Microthlaspi erraticum TaxID=1685480 RepID=A0A6D2LBZ5_9BRAS|nr:unnamed protein product [Microthlaspi erraticum]